jgi:hypothetical protein
VASSLSAIKAALKARCVAYLPTDVRCYAEDPGNPQPPAVWAYGPIEGTNYDQSFDGLTRYFLTLVVGLSSADVTRAQDAMNAYLSPTGSRSLRSALAADPSLGGVVDTARVIGVEESPRLADAAGSGLLRASVRVEVLG